MKALDTIARDICWQDQTRARREGRSKAKFWTGLTEDAREGYRGIARRFVVLLHALPITTVQAAHDLRGKP